MHRTAQEKTSSPVDLDVWQQAQDALAALSGLSVMLLGRSGEQLTKPSRFNALCDNLLSGSARHRALCWKSHAKAAAEVAATLRPVFYRCHAGFSFFALPVIVNDAHIATAVAGQALIEGGADRRTLERFLKEARLSIPDVSAGIDRGVRSMTNEEFTKTAGAFAKIIGNMSILPEGAASPGRAEISLLHGLAELDGAGFCVSSMMDRLCDRIAAAAAVGGCAIIVRDRGRDGFIVSCSEGLSKSFREKFSAITADMLFERRFATRRQMIDEAAADTGEDFAAMYSQAGISRRITLPLVTRGTMLGLLELYPEESAGISAERASEFVQIAAQAAAAVDNSFILSRAGRLASKDSLTGLTNYASFQGLLAVEIKRAQRYKQALVLLMIDLDNFSSINDTYGHLIGNMVLTEMSGILFEGVRDVDTVARFGGEEFVIVLPETPMDGALIVAERLRARIAAHDFPGPGMRRLRLTASIGVAEFMPGAQSPEQLIMAADRALLRAKALGKDRVVKASRTQPAAKKSAPKKNKK